MALHLLSARKLVAELAADAVPVEDQAIYLALGFIAWLVPVYLYVSPGFMVDAPLWKYTLWFGEFALLVGINWAGVLHCLRECHYRPERHFMIDFGCLYAPASIVVLGGTWAVFYAALWSYHFIAVALRDEALDAAYLRVHDVLNYATVAGQVALIYYVVGRGIRRAADLRAGA